MAIKPEKYHGILVQPIETDMWIPNRCRCCVFNKHGDLNQNVCRHIKCCKNERNGKRVYFVRLVLEDNV